MNNATRAGAARLRAWLTAGALPLIGLCLMLAACLPRQANGQAVQIGDTTASLRTIHTETGRLVASEWTALANHPKTKTLLNWAAVQLRCTPVPLSQNGFTTTGQLRFLRAGAPVATEQEVRQTIFPVRCVSLRYPKASVALLLNRYISTPGLSYPRLLVRYGNNDYMVEEYSLRRDGSVTQMTAKFGDCVFRTSLRILEQRNGNAYKSLMAVFSTSAQEPVFNTLKRLYDVRMTPVGQKDLVLYSGILVASNLEEEFDAGYISGTLDQSFKPERNDSWAVAEAKKLAKSILTDLLKKVGQALGSIILGWLGF
jgi:hypothetical protein